MITLLCARTPGSCTAMPSITGATLRGRYARLTQLMPSPERPSWITAFHCANRAGGHSVATPAFVYGPNHRDHSLPGSSVLPERTKNSTRAAPLDLAATLSSGVGGGLHQSSRPHCEKSCASKERDS